jgi:tetratricopeptide (TPR) repeat protein
VLSERPNDESATEGLASSRRAQVRAREAAVKALIGDAEQKLGDGAYDEAIAIFESVLKQDSASPEALAGLGRVRKAKAAEEALFKSRAKKPPG